MKPSQSVRYSILTGISEVHNAGMKARHRAQDCPGLHWLCAGQASAAPLAVSQQALTEKPQTGGGKQGTEDGEAKADELIQEQILSSE